MKLSATIMDAYEGSDGDIGRRSGDGVETEWRWSGKPTKHK